MASVLDRFITRFDAGRRHEITVHAPPSVVLDVARRFDMQSIPAVRFIIWLRGLLLGARAPTTRPPVGLMDEMLALGWGRLAEEPDRWLVAGAVWEPWQGNVVFTPIAPDRFAGDWPPDRVKIAWTLEAEPLDSERTRFATETRAVATDAIARAKFKRYWRKFGIGIAMIRWFLLPALRREAERRWRAERGSPGIAPAAGPGAWPRGA